MDTQKIVPFSTSLPKSYRDLLRKIAAEHSLKNPDAIVTAARLAREIICQYLRDLELKEKVDEVGRREKPE